MLKILLALPPIISIAHVFLAIILFLLNIEYTGNLFILFFLPITLVTFIHIYIAIVDNSLSKSEHIGYALVHIPFSITFSLLALLLFIPKGSGMSDSTTSLLQCVNQSEAECLNNFYLPNSKHQQNK
jgi:hypothetical protein